MLDGAGDPVPDALLEIWQADAAGRIVPQAGVLHRDGWTFTGWGRAATDDDGRYTFTTVEPGPVEGQAPFFAMTVFARGLLDRLFTRVYLPDHPLLAADPLLASLPEDRRRTLIAGRDHDGLASTSTCRATARPSSSAIPDTEAMTDLFWPGDERAGDLLTEESFLAAMVRVEAAWLRALVDAGIAPPRRTTISRARRPVRRGGRRGLLRRRRQPGDPPGRAAARAPRGPRPGGGHLAAPRAHQPGRRRHRAGAVAAGDRTR